jgi:hypothetical protein
LYRLGVIRLFVHSCHLYRITEIPLYLNTETYMMEHHSSPEIHFTKVLLMQFECLLVNATECVTASSPISIDWLCVQSGYPHFSLYPKLVRDSMYTALRPIRCSSLDQIQVAFSMQLKTIPCAKRYALFPITMTTSPPPSIQHVPVYRTLRRVAR